MCGGDGGRVTGVRDVVVGQLAVALCSFAARSSFLITSVLPLRGELTVSSSLFIVFLQRNKLRFHFAVGETIDKAFWYLQKRHLAWREVALKKSPSTRSFTLRKLECFKQAVKRFLISGVGDELTWDLGNCLLNIISMG